MPFGKRRPDRHTKRNTTAFILSLTDAGLGAVRSLGRAGIPVIGLDYDRHNTGFASRYCTPLICPHPVREPEKTVDFLVDAGRRLAEPGILIPASDAFALLISRNREVLEPYYRFTLPRSEVLESIANKRRQYELAQQAMIPCPVTYYPATVEDVQCIKDQLRYPAFIKPCSSILWHDHFLGNEMMSAYKPQELMVRFKGIRVHTPDEFVASYEQVLNIGVEAMVQEVILGPDSNIYSARVYVSQQGDLLALFTTQKLRQYPPEFGVGTLVESGNFPLVGELGVQFCRAIDYRGIASIEFKKDDRDGKLKLVELNPRLWTQNIHATDCGINFPLIQYQDLVGDAPAPQTTFRTGVRWLDAVDDFRSALWYLRAGRLTRWEWIRSWVGARSFATFSLDDPKPFLKKYGYGLTLLRAPRYFLTHHR